MVGLPRCPQGMRELVLMPSDKALKSAKRLLVVKHDDFRLKTRT